MNMNMNMNSSYTMMTFHSDITDSLYATAWTPSSPAGYAGTWIFLFFLGIIARGLTAIQIQLDRYWIGKFSTIRITVNKNGESEVISGPRLSHIWRASVEFPRALLFMVISGVYYLLMIAVMTLNVGYFFAVLAGLFFGQFTFGRFTSGYELHVGEH